MHVCILINFTRQLVQYIISIPNGLVILISLFYTETKLLNIYSLRPKFVSGSTCIDHLVFRICRSLMSHYSYTKNDLEKDRDVF